MQITKDLYYVGVNDRRKHLFEGLWPLPKGVSYNSYLLVDEKVALIEPVDVNFFSHLLTKLQAILGDRQIDYLVVNHMEPDHSGSISLLRKYYPNVRIVGNKQTLQMVKGFYGEESEEDVLVAEGSELNLGAHTLRFYMTPLVHWPETMMAFDELSGTLFSGDAFGTFGALNGAVLDKDLDIEPYWAEMKRYYSNIVGKYGAQVQRAMQKLAGLSIQRICSTHGPVWQENIAEVTALYDRLSRYEGRRGVTVCYGSMYGNTENMAEAVCEGIAAEGIKDIRVHNLSESHLSHVLADIFDLDTLVLGAPTYNTQIYPPMQELLAQLKLRGVKNRRVAIFGSFTWASAAVKILSAFVEEMGWTLVGAPIEMKQGFNTDIAAQCRQLGHELGRQ
ncbi:MAG: FprA family A-type flavoprotein [Alloprevotella sp.]|nr:FprA family A-type flavoprotein [Alloprevotella sp.]